MAVDWNQKQSTQSEKRQEIVTEISRNNPSKSSKNQFSKKEISELERMEIFVPEVPSRCLDDLIVPLSLRTRIDAALNRIRFHDVLYNQWNLKKVDPNGKRIAINLFGLPGTGKTFCAEAIAHHLNRKIIKVNYAEIESKYVGETPKNITAAFKKARETDSVLFFDEADSILGKRLTHVTQSADHGVNVSRSVMLLQLDKFDGVVIFATNLARNYDGAFVRRILTHIEFELPDAECRIRLWQYLLPVEVPRADDVSLEWLASESEGLAGGDILNIVIASASRAVERTGDNRQVSREDILEEINHVRISKKKIGSRSDSDRKIIMKETEMKPDELPADVQERYETVVFKNNI
jgi:SpoVK/Ycf46/Vps4 family AAA+-type ATPase